MRDRLSALGQRRPPPLRARRDDIALLVEHFRGEVNQSAGLGLDITSMSRGAMAILEGDDWPGNVRELEAVVKRAMILRNRGRVMPEDIVLPKLQRDRVLQAAQTHGHGLSLVQAQALHVAQDRGEVRRRDLVVRCEISPESARRALLGLERAGLVRRAGHGRGARYVLTAPAETVGVVAASAT